MLEQYSSFFSHFILTGSSVPPDSTEIEHSGAGRIVQMIMRTMSLFESKDSNGTISLSVLFNHEPVSPAVCKTTLADYAYLTCRGGWPTAVTAKSEKIALAQARNYYDALVNTDMIRLGKKQRSTIKIASLLKSYARNTATESPNTTLIEDIKKHNELPLDEKTVASYIRDLETLYVIEELPAWKPNIRSKSAIRTTNTRHFIDPSIGCASLKISPDDLLHDLQTFGLFFESLAVRDLRIYAESLFGTVAHYRDSNGLEADAILKLDDDRWAAVEVKLCNPERIEEGAQHLLKLADTVDERYMGKPAFLMVITAAEYAYQRKDGVWIVPLACLKP